MVHSTYHTCILNSQGCRCSKEQLNPRLAPGSHPDLRVPTPDSDGLSRIRVAFWLPPSPELKNQNHPCPLELYNSIFTSMDLLSEISAPSMALASGVSLAAGAYLNAKLAISTDLAAMRNDRLAMKRMGQRIGDLGGLTTVYKMLERVVERGSGATDALWFEGKTRSYSQLKDRRCS